ncbi:MAG: hypothetical protein ACR2GY_12175 [Phycisphaerales bacterium]
MVLLLLLCTISGCSASKTRGTQGPGGQRSGVTFSNGVGNAAITANETSIAAGGSVLAAQWPFWPTGMRIHPLTMRWSDRATGAPYIEARLEFLDAFGHTAKTVCQVRFELFESSPSSADAEAFRTWSIDIRDPGQNALHYDAITRTYLFRLALEQPLDDQTTWHLRGRVLSVDGRTFEDLFEI